MMRVFFIVVLLSLPGISESWAQYWTASPFVPGASSHYVTFSNDDKRVYYLSGGEISGIDLKKKDTVFQVTPKADAPIVRMMHAFGKPTLLYMRATAAHPTDFHLYRIADDGKTPAEDLTPSGEGIQNTMLGMAYNGRYLYYSSNKRNLAKTDYYRYDIPQNISEMVLSNDKQFELMAWSRDQRMILLKEPATSKLMASDNETTERFTFYTPAVGKVKAAGWTPDAKELVVVEEAPDGTVVKSFPMTSTNSVGQTAQEWEKGAISNFDFSVNGKYIIERKAGVLSIKETASKAEVQLPAPVAEINTNGKESLFLMITGDGNAKKLQIFDVVKKTTVDLGAISE